MTCPHTPDPFDPRDLANDACCDDTSNHYHCEACGQATGMMGHWVAGPDGKIICDEQERIEYALAYLASQARESS